MKQSRIRSAIIASAATGLLGAAVVAVTALPASATARTHSAGTSAAAAQTATDEAAPSGKITVEVKTVNGSGCPDKSTFTVDPSPDNTSFSITYRRFAAFAGGGAEATDSRKFCQISLWVKVPQGFTYAIARAEYHGYAHLESGATATERGSYYFQGSTDTTSVNHNFTGPLDGSWTRIDTTPVDALVYAPCGIERDLNVKTALVVDQGSSDPDATSIIAIDQSRDSVKTLYHFAWKRC